MSRHVQGPKACNNFLMRCSASAARDSESEKWKQKMLGESQPESGWIMHHDHVLSSDSVRKDGHLTAIGSRPKMIW
jgi:hypothetical protein